MLRCWGCPVSWKAARAYELLVHLCAEGVRVQSRTSSLLIATPASHFCQPSSSISQHRAHRHTVSSPTAALLTISVPPRHHQVSAHQPPCTAESCQAWQCYPEGSRDLSFLPDHPSGDCSSLSHLQNKEEGSAVLQRQNSHQQICHAALHGNMKGRDQVLRVEAQCWAESVCCSSAQNSSASVC